MSSDPIEVLRDAARNAVIALRNCVNAGQIGAGYRQYADELESALASLSAPKPEGEWVLVPRDASEDMIAIAMDANRDFMCGADVRDVWRAMLAAAPKPESAGAVGWIDRDGDVWKLWRDIPHSKLRDARPLFTAPPRPEASDAAWLLPILDAAAQDQSVSMAAGDAARRIRAGHAPQQACAPVGVAGDAVAKVVTDMRKQAAELEGSGGCEDAWAHHQKKFADRLDALAQQPAAVDEAVERVRLGPSRLWQADLVGGQISVERMREILAAALAGQQGGTPE